MHVLPYILQATEVFAPQFQGLAREATGLVLFKAELKEARLLPVTFIPFIQSSVLKEVTLDVPVTLDVSLLAQRAWALGIGAVLCSGICCQDYLESRCFR